MKKLFVLPTYLCLASLSLADDATSKAASAEVAKPGLSPSSQNPSSQSGPIRVLFLGTEAGGSRKHCHTVMRDFGRDALVVRLHGGSGPGHRGVDRQVRRRVARCSRCHLPSAEHRAAGESGDGRLLQQQRQSRSRGLSQSAQGKAARGCRAAAPVGMGAVFEKPRSRRSARSIRTWQTTNAARNRSLSSIRSV